MNEVKTENKEKKQGDSWDSVKGFAVWLGTYGWIFLLITGIIYIIGGLALLTLAAIFVGYGIIGPQTLVETTIRGAYYLIGGILAIIFTVAFVKPRFSNKWAEEDYDYLLNDVVTIGKTRIPLMLIIGIILEIFLSGWGGLISIVPILLLIFMGQKEYKWTEEEKKTSN